MSAASEVPVGSGPGSRAGSELREARERLGWDLGEVAAALRIKLAYLQAIEDGRLAALPGNAYALGFLRTYATTLGLDADDVARRFRAEAHDVNRKPVLSFPTPVPERGVPTSAMVLLGVVLALIAYVGWYRLTDRRHVVAHVVPAVPEQLLGSHPAQPLSPQVASVMPSPGTAVPAAGPGLGAGTTAPPATSPQPRTDTVAAPVAATSAAPATIAAAPAAAAAPATPAAAPVAGLSLLATGVAWVQVHDADGHVLWDHIMQPGDTWQVPAGRAGLTLTTGNAGGIELVRDGKPSDPLGRVGAVRRGIALDATPVEPVAPVAAAPAPAAAVVAPAASPVAAPVPPPVAAPAAAPVAAPVRVAPRHAAPAKHVPNPDENADDLNARQLKAGPATH